MQGIECILKYFRIILALEAHEIHSNEDMNIDFSDNNRTPIFSTDLFGVISQKFASGCFYVELKISGESNKSITVAVCLIVYRKEMENIYFLNF